ncbi:MAG: primosomal protein, partial [Proteobacteria bacterium]|nr:primosomal protein [Pseudomonadota bacterium]
MSDSMKLLTEWRPFEYSKEMIEESKKLNGGRIVLRGILQKANTLNQNGRIYPVAVLDREVRNYQKFIKENRALGELDHPDSSVVELKNASHIVREARMEGEVCFGTVELLETPSGKILQSLVESGVTL